MFKALKSFVVKECFLISSQHLIPEYNGPEKGANGVSLLRYANKIFLHLATLFILWLYYCLTFTFFFGKIKIKGKAGLCQRFRMSECFNLTLPKISTHE